MPEYAGITYHKSFIKPVAFTVDYVCSMQYFKYYLIVSIACIILFPVWPSGIEKLIISFVFR